MSQDSIAPSDYTVDTASIEEVRIDDECFTPVEYSPYGSGGSFSERCSGREGPSPVFTPHAPSGLLDPHVGSALDVASNVFTPDKIIIPKTHILRSEEHTSELQSQ